MYGEREIGKSGKGNIFSAKGWFKVRLKRMGGEDEKQKLQNFQSFLHLHMRRTLLKMSYFTQLSHEYFWGDLFEGEFKWLFSTSPYTLSLHPPPFAPLVFENRSFGNYLARERIKFSFSFPLLSRGKRFHIRPCETGSHLRKKVQDRNIDNRKINKHHYP